MPKMYTVLLDNAILNCARKSKLLEPQRLMSTVGKSKKNQCDEESLKPSKLIIRKTKNPKTKQDKENLIFGHDFTDHMLICKWNIDGGWKSPIIKEYGEISLQPSASVFHYAIECFEGLKAYKDKLGNVRLFRPMMNMQRFAKSAARLSLPSPNGKELMQLLCKLLAIDSDWIPEGQGYSLYIRPTLISTYPAIGISAPKEAMLFVICSPVGPYYKTGFSAVSLYAENGFVRAWPGGTGNYKIGANYASGILPQKRVAPQGYQQILWLFGENDLVTEVGSMNFFVFWRNENGERELVTAPLDDGTILPGVTRDSILEICKKRNKFKISERTLTMSQIITAIEEDRIIEMFGSGTAAVISPIKKVYYKGKDWLIPLDPQDPTAEAGPLATELWNTINSIQYGAKEFNDWSFVVPKEL